MMFSSKHILLLMVLACGAFLFPLTAFAAQTNNPPDAVDDNVITLVDTSVAFNVVANDVDVDGNLDVTTAAALTLPLNGTLLNNGSGLFDYSPNSGFTGIDSFTYQVCDTLLLCDVATVAITVVVNSVPDAVDDSIMTPEDTPITIDVIANDVDAENNLNPTSVAVIVAPANGTAVSNADGTVTYSPAANYTGPDSFVYSVCDTEDLCDSATVTIDVTLVNDPPDCAAVASSVGTIWPPNHKMVSVNVLGVTDVDNDPLTIVITDITSDEPDNGTGDGDTSGDTAGVGTNTAQVRAERAGNGDGRVYEISFTVDDGQGGACSNTVSVFVPHDQRDVLPVEPAPTVEEAALPGDFGCERPGNSCNAPGHNQSGGSETQSQHGNRNQGNGHSSDDDDSGNGRGNGNGNNNGNGNGKK